MGQTERQTDARQLQPSVLSMQTVSVRRYVCNCAAHMLSQHGTAPPGVRVYNCTLCNYKCIDKNRFEEHEAMHTGRLLCDCYAPALGGALSDTAIRPSVPWRSCLGYGHAGCLQLSYHQPPEMFGLRTQPRTDVDPPRFLPPSNCHRRGRGISSRCPWGDTLLDKLNFYHMMHTYSAVHCCGAVSVYLSLSQYPTVHQE